MPVAKWTKHTLHFRIPGGTSRGVLQDKTSYILSLHNEETGKVAYGECSLIKGLSPDPEEGLKAALPQVCSHLENKGPLPDLAKLPALRFAVEMLKKDWENDCNQLHFPNDFSDGNDCIPINGLIWMGKKEFMQEQIDSKVGDGFKCLKMKVGALDFQEELEVLKWIRKKYGPTLELRLDANGAFSPTGALEKLKRLSEFNIHSIEQPLKPGQWEPMAKLCNESPIPIALDEELIGTDDKQGLLHEIKAPYIILKPSLLGGWAETDDWIRTAEEVNTEWWVTSALESNVGLNAIAQYTSSKFPILPQGLGTGQLFTNNFGSPLYISHGNLYHNGCDGWDFSLLHGN